MGAARRSGLVLAMLLAVGTPASAAPVPPLADIARREAPLPESSTALGTGFFIAPDRILTSAHVLAGCRAFLATNPVLGAMTARLVSRDGARDSALLSVDIVSPFVIAPSPTPPGTGAALSVLGYPKGRAGGQAPERFAAAHRARLKDGAGVPVLSLGTQLAAGVSGGPVLDRSGRLVGIVVGRRSDAPDTVIALATDGLSPATRRRFAPSLPADRPGVTEAGSAVVQIRCQ